jgi:hypothetical protein
MRTAYRDDTVVTQGTHFAETVFNPSLSVKHHPPFVAKVPISEASSQIVILRSSLFLSRKRANDSSLCNFVNKRRVHHVPGNIYHLQAEKTGQMCRRALSFINTCRIRCLVYFRGWIPVFHTAFVKRKCSFMTAISQCGASMKYVCMK